MGHVYYDVTIVAERETLVKMLVDTGATYTVISPELAEQAGVKTIERTYSVRLADGSEVPMQMAVALLRIDDREAPATILVGPVDEPILGVETLEALGLAVDPSNGSLTPTRSYSVRLGGMR